MGPLVDYLPDSECGQTKMSLNDESTIADLLSLLKIKQRVAVAVNGEQEKEMKDLLKDGDNVMVFTNVSGG